MRTNRIATAVRLLATVLVVAGSLLVAGPVQSAVASTSSTPPFTECPAVGASPSCKVLIIINSDRTVSVYDNPAVGNYDGGDDTLVGVLNQSGIPLDAITVSGPGSGLAGLDGDGLCTYGVPGCPFGASGYEGPGTSFVRDPTSTDLVEVDFGPQLGPAQSTYFSLEGTLTAASLVARQGTLGGAVSPLSGPPDTVFTASYHCASGVVRLDFYTSNGVPVAFKDAFYGIPQDGGNGNYTQHFQFPLEGSYSAVPVCDGVAQTPAPFYVAATAGHAGLGDSYSSGEGADVFYSNTGSPSDLVSAPHLTRNQCHRSPTAWAFGVGSAHGFSTWLDACSGALINDFYRYNSQNPDEVPQLDNISGTTTKLVTLTIGGNDVGFPDLLSACVVGLGNPAGQTNCAGKRFGGLATTASEVKTALGWLKNGRTSSQCQDIPGVNSDTGKKDRICETAPALHTVYLDIARRIAKGGTLVVAGYPEFFGDPLYPLTPGHYTGSGTCSVAGYSELGDSISYTDARFLNDGARRLNFTISSEVRHAAYLLSSIGRSDVHILFADVDGFFAGHRICDAGNRWLNTVNIGVSSTTTGILPFDLKQTSFHPTYDGQKAYVSGVDARPW